MQVDFDNLNAVVSYIKSFGLKGPLIIFALFFIQAVAPIFPYIILAGAAGIIYGFTEGFFLAWGGALAGAGFLYYLSRFLGCSFFLKKVQNKYGFDLQSIDGKNVFLVLLLSRVFPIVPTPLINVGSGLGGVSPSIFFLSSAVGKLPWAIIYVALGDYLIKSENLTNTVTAVCLVLLVSVLGIYYFRKRIPKLQKK